ncbi:MAG: hypothetical protein KKB30_05440 [Proteobacteria bacterium]|nr:hypothetical protein [Pseudomonadota bacterium]MBU1716143.1 hypothetical protein [Pseudomonadota bacterium]
MAETDSTPKGFRNFILAVPYQWHLALAVAVYLILHALAAREIPLPDQSPESTALYAHRLVWKTAASLFQYILPAAFSLAGIFSFRRGREYDRRINK